MKTQKVTQERVKDTAIKVLGLVGGFMLGGAFSAVVPSESRTIARIGIAGGGAIAHTTVKDDGGLGTILKYAGMGAGAREVYGLVTDQLQKNADPIGADANVMERAYYGAIGLACPCDDDFVDEGYADADFENYHFTDNEFLLDGGQFNPSGLQMPGMEFDNVFYDETPSMI